MLAQSIWTLAFATLARIAGHSSITITQRYVHPQADAIERAFQQTANVSVRELSAQAL